MKINVVIPTTLMGGGLRVAFHYANDWVDRGHDVLVYIPMLYEEVDRKIKLTTSLANSFKRGTKVTWMDTKFKVKKALNISNAFIRDADVTIAIGPCSARRVSRLSERKGKKVLLVQGHELNETGSNLEDIDRTYTYDMNHVVLTRYMDNYIYKLTGKHSEIVYNGIPEAEYITHEKVSNDPPTIIMLANFGHYKGGYEGLNILKRLHEKYGVKCLLYGINKDPNIPEDFEFHQLPERSELMDMYRRADICLFPSIEEGWGLIVTEAMANRCAVVGNNTGCLREFGVHGENAMITPQVDFALLEQYVVEVIKNKELLEKLQENGYRKALEINAKASDDKFEQYLLRLLEK